MKKALAVIALATASFLLLTGFGPHRGGRFARDPQKVYRFITWKVNDTLDDLNATEVQRAKINAVKDRLLAEGAKMMVQRQADREVVRAQWQSPQPDAARLHGMVDERIEGARAFFHKLVDAFVEVHATLTPEQRAQLEQELPPPMGGFGGE